MHRLQPVAGIGQRALGDGGERVGEVALLEGAAEIDDARSSGGRSMVVVLALAMRTNHSGRYGNLAQW